MGRTLKTKPANATLWTTRRMAEAIGLSDTSVPRIWHEFGLQPHRSETFKLSIIATRCPRKSWTRGGHSSQVPLPATKLFLIRGDGFAPDGPCRGATRV